MWWWSRRSSGEESRRCTACEVYADEVRYLREKVDRLEDRLFLDQGPDQIRVAARARMVREEGFGPEMPEDEMRPQLPPTVFKAIDEMSEGDPELFESLERWAAATLATGEADPERIADAIYSGADPLAQT